MTKAAAGLPALELFHMQMTFTFFGDAEPVHQRTVASALARMVSLTAVDLYFGHMHEKEVGPMPVHVLG